MISASWEIEDFDAVQCQTLGEKSKEGQDNHDVVTYSLAATVEDLSSEWPREFLSWVLLIHFGA